MRILVLADIHANWPALAAIEERFDACLVIGDLVDYGTDPVPCVEWVRQNADYCIRGNHDHAVAQRVTPRPGSGYRRLAFATRKQQWSQLNPLQIRFLARLPVTQTVRIDGLNLLLLHATPRDPLDEYLGQDAIAWEQRLKGIQADIVCVGHTHVPYLLNVNGTRVLNPGSVGQPRDSDPRCSYAIIENGRVEFRRVEYDIDASLRQMRQVGTESSAIEMTEAVLRTGGRFAMTMEPALPQR